MGGRVGSVLIVLQLLILLFEMSNIKTVSRRGEKPFASRPTPTVLYIKTLGPIFPSYPRASRTK